MTSTVTVKRPLKRLEMILMDQPEDHHFESFDTQGGFRPGVQKLRVRSGGSRRSLDSHSKYTRKVNDRSRTREGRLETKGHKRTDKSKVPPLNGTLERRSGRFFPTIKSQTTRKKNNTPVHHWRIEKCTTSSLAFKVNFLMNIIFSDWHLHLKSVNSSIYLKTSVVESGENLM